MSESPFKRHEPLYLKYRPQSLGQLVGQEGVYRTLVNAIEHNRLTHAYLFTGPRGTGKTSSARILAKSLNCKTAGKPTVEPCQTCSCCTEITQGNSPAVFEIDAASNNSVDDARVLIERAPLKAVGGEFKVYIIDECHMLTKEAFNALLKTIEQPPPGVVFILATTEEHKVLPTIVSRCQRLMFKLINQEALTNHLRHVAKEEAIEIEDDALQLIARRSGGGLRDALSNLDQASLLAAPGSPATVSDLLRLLGALHEDVLLDISKQIAERSGQAVIDSVSQLLGEGREPQVVLQELSRHFLSLMKASYLIEGKANTTALSTVVLGSESYLSGLMVQAPLFERSELSQIVEQIDKLEQTCRRSSQPAMHLEIGLLSICHRHDINLVKDLIARVQHLEERIAGGAEIEHGGRPQHMPGRPQHTQAAPANSAPAYQSSHSQTAPASSAPAYQAPRPQAAPVSAAPAYQATNPQMAPAASIDQNIREAEQPARAATQNPAADSPQEMISISTLPASSANFDNERTPSLPANSESRSPAAENNSPGSAAVSADGDDPRIQELNSDIDYIWQQILDELQRRHVPTFSLASTHAFPLNFSNKEINIGVMKENFQKMLEGKVNHLKVATQAITGLDLIVKIRVATEANPAPKKNQPINRPAGSQAVDERPVTAAGADAASQPNTGMQGSGPQYQEQGMQGSASQYPDRGIPASGAQHHDQNIQGPEAQNGQARRGSGGESESLERTNDEGGSNSSSDSNSSAGASTGALTGEFDATMVKEAYKLFEGPGSRRIT